jgi:uncharacterized glyoxalase superfamily protein PhnB
MIQNRSVPTNILLPHLVYRDVDAAAAWLGRVFGFAEHYRHGGEPTSGVQMHLGHAWIMLTRAREGRESPTKCGCWTQSLTVFVEDVERHFERARTAGAIIVEELHETVYGELQYGVTDLEGHHWLFSRHAKDVSPEKWGAKVAGK